MSNAKPMAAITQISHWTGVKRCRAGVPIGSVRGVSKKRLSPLQRGDLDLPEVDLRQLRLEHDLPAGKAGAGSGVHHLAVHGVGEGVPVAGDLVAGPLAGRALHVVLPPESEGVLPVGIATVPVDPGVLEFARLGL